MYTSFGAKVEFFYMIERTWQTFFSLIFWSFIWKVNVGMNFFLPKLRFWDALFSFRTSTETFAIVFWNINDQKMDWFWSILLEYASFCRHIFLDWNLQELLTYVSVLLTSSLFDNRCDEDSDLLTNTACTF